MKPFPLIFAALGLGFLVLRRRRLEVESKVMLLLLVAGLAIYGTGVVKIPNLETLLVDIGSSLGHWTYLLVGGMAFAETGAFLGFVAPGEVTVLVGGLVAGQGQINVILLLAIVWSCAVAGDLTSFVLGRRLGREFLVRHGARVKITEERLRQVEGFFERRGGMTILVGRFLGLVRPIAPFLAGSTGMAFRRFLAVDILAAGLWSTTFVLIGYVFWHSFDRVVEVAKQGAFALGATVAIVAAVAVAVGQLRDEERRRALQAWLDAQAERRWLRPAARVARVLWRRVLAPAGRRLSGPARFAWERLTPGALGLELTTLLAVAAVGGFAFLGYAIALDGIGETPGDLRVLDWVADLQSAWAVDAAQAVGWIGSGGVVGAVVVLAAAWLVWRRRVVDASVLVGGMALTAIAVEVTKDLADRARPLGGLVETTGSSFPSAHAAYAVALVAVVITVTRTAPVRAAALTPAIVLVAAAVGLTGLYLRVQYLSDVLAGFGLAAAIFALCAMVALIVTFVRQNGEAAA